MSDFPLTAAGTKPVETVLRKRAPERSAAAVAPLRVAYFSLSFPELTQTFVFNEMRGLKALGVDVDVIALAPPRGELSDLPQQYGFGGRIHYVRTASRKPRRLERIWVAAKATVVLMLAGRADGVLNLLRANARDAPLPRWLALTIAGDLQRHACHADIIHSHFGPAGRVVAHLKALGLIDAKTTTVFHGYDITQYLDGKSENVYREVIDEIDLLLPISELWHRRLIDLGASPHKAKTLRLGIDLGTFTYKPRHLASGDPMRFISVGRMTEKKGHRYSIDAFAALIAQRPDLDLRLDVIGSGPDLEAMRAQVTKAGLSDRITLHGGLPHREVRALLDRAHVFVLHSVTARDGDMEGIPVSIMEAMAMGLPVLSTRHSGIPEIVADSVSGLLVDERDTTATTRAMARLVDEPGLIEQMGRAGRAIVERDYNAQKQAERLHDALTRLSAGGN